MVKKSKKSKSKRVPLRKKYKILKKVKAHHKKKAKEAKKAGNKKAKVEKDPGIPNAWPFKEQELKALEEKRARALKEIEEKKQAKKERAQKRKLGIEEDASLSDLVRRADARANEFEGRKKKEGRSGSKDGSKRAFYKELLKVIEASDVIIEVLDARDPLGTRCPDVERLVMKSGSPKRLVLLMNKIDLVPKEIAEKWLKYLREELPTVAFKCSTQKQKSNLGQKKVKSKEVLETNDCLGADTLLQLLKNYSRNQEMKTAITVGVVGLPNAGKSSLINSLKRTRVVNTGATPGVTKTLQEVQLDKHVKLLDCPGVVMASAAGETAASLNLRNCVRIEKLEDPVSPVGEILRLCGHEKLMSIFKIPAFKTLDEFLQLVGTVRGKFKKGGVVDAETAARIVLFEWNEGKIPHCTLPPARPTSEYSESAIVSEWTKEFNVDELLQSEKSLFASLPSLNDADEPVEVPASAPMSLDETMMVDSEAEDNEEDEQQPKSMDTSEGAAPSSTGEKSASQTEKLYDAEGIFNPHLARAEKKRRKKSSTAADDSMDYDFDVDYVVDEQGQEQQQEEQQERQPKKQASKRVKSKSKIRAKKKEAEGRAMEE